MYLLHAINSDCQHDCCMSSKKLQEFGGLKNDDRDRSFDSHAQI